MKVCGTEITVHGRLVRIARLAADGFEFLKDPGALLAALRQCESRIDLFTFTQELPETAPRHGYPLEWDNVAALPISTFADWWTRQINDKTRNMVRRAAKKGVVVREVPFDDELVEGIGAIYRESPVRQGKPFRHYGKDLDTLRRDHATFLDRSVFLGAFLDAELIGFVKLVDAERQTALMQIISMLGHRDKAPTNALIAHSVRSCAERGRPYLVYSRFAYGGKQRDSLSDFKEHNGFRRIDVPRYYVPLTLAGRASLGLGLHHGFAARIPEPVVTKLREMRGLWYNLKVRDAKPAS
jgi:hypothetical protein